MIYHLHERDNIETFLWDSDTFMDEVFIPERLDFTSFEIELAKSEGDSKSNFMNIEGSAFLLRRPLYQILANDLGDECQFHELTMQGEKYWLCHCFNVIDAFDKENSIFDYEDDNYYITERLKFLEKRVQGALLFRVPELPDIFATERFRNIIISQDILDIRFHQVDGQGYRVWDDDRQRMFEAILFKDSLEIEEQRDHIEESDIPFFVQKYWECDWDRKFLIIDQVQDQMSPLLKPVMLDALGAPPTEDDSCAYAQSVALCYLEAIQGNFELRKIVDKNFSNYLDSPNLRSKAIRKYMELT